MRDFLRGNALRTGGNTLRVIDHHFPKGLMCYIIKGKGWALQEMSI
jgi:hypothetical protein